MRAYYSKANKEERPDLMVKKLRYYARFVISAISFGELAKLIDDYTGIYQPADALEWSMVLQEIKAFMDADSAVQVVEHDSSPVVLTHRLGPATCRPPSGASRRQPLHLAEILIVGNCAD
uniref:ASCH domain-containing protein n=1 Tax=Macrostomum lignano TaxID=282301 RepID=A0A1I8F8D4_9PLAT